MTKQAVGRIQNSLISDSLSLRHQSTAMILVKTRQKTNNGAAGAAGIFKNCLHVCLYQNNNTKEKKWSLTSMWTHNIHILFLSKKRSYDYRYKVLKPTKILKYLI